MSASRDQNASPVREQSRPRAARTAAGRRCLRSTVFAWDFVVERNKIPPYVLPGPRLVFDTLISDWGGAVGRR